MIHTDGNSKLWLSDARKMQEKFWNCWLCLQKYFLGKIMQCNLQEAVMRKTSHQMGWKGLGSQFLVKVTVTIFTAPKLISSSDIWHENVTQGSQCSTPTVGSSPSSLTPTVEYGGQEVKHLWPPPPRMAWWKLTWSYSLDLLLQPGLVHHLLHKDCSLLLHLQATLELLAANLATEVQLLKPKAVLELPCTRQPRQLLHWLVREFLLQILRQFLPISPRKPFPLILMELLLPAVSLHLLLPLLLSQEELCQLIQLKLHQPFLLRRVLPLLLLLLGEVPVIQNHLLLQQVICLLLPGENQHLLQETPPGSWKHLTMRRNDLTCTNAIICSQVDSAVRRYFAIPEI